MATTVAATRKKVALSAAAMCAAVLIAASVAWACTPQAGISVNPRSGEAGTRTLVSGERFAEVPVEIRWGSRVLATASGPAFSVNVTIPADAPSGTHYIQAVTPDGQGSATATFVVRSGTDSEPAQPAPAQPAPAQPASEQPAPAAAPGEPAPARAAAPAAPAPAPAARDAARRTAAAAGRPTAPASDRPAGGGTAPAAPAAAPEVPAGAALAPETATPSPRSVSADVWGGFATGDLDTVQGPGLVGTQPTGDGGGPATLGVALLAIGLVTLSAGAFAALRRRQPAAAADRQP